MDDRVVYRSTQGRAKMKSKFLVVFLCISVLLGVGFYPLLAQQGIPQLPGGPQSANPQGLFQPPMGGQMQSPSFGGQPYGTMQQPAPQGQGYYSQRAPGSQPQSVDLSQINQRACGWATLSQSPISPPQSVVPSTTQTVPVQGSWPGSPETTGIQGVGAGQPFGAQVGAGQQQSGAGTGLPVQNPIGSRGPQFYYEPLSTIEATYQSPAFAGEKPRELRQYGYSLFASPVSTFAPVEDVPVGPDYVLGPGDDLAINIQAVLVGAILLTIDRNGQIILPSAGPVRVWGLTFSQADQLIREQLSRYYRGFQTSVTMGRLRTIRVYVVGEVCQPGSFTLSSLSTVTNALFASGGQLKLGSLRNIEIKRNHHSVGTLDLYDFLLRGDKTRDFRLESGDTIFIPPVGPIAAIDGEVKRPGIYEIKGATRVTDIIEMAGGLMPQSYLKRVQVIRNKPNAEREVIDLDLAHLGQGGNGDSPKDIEVRNGDLVKIYPTDPRIYNTISLAGVVKHPGEYEIKTNMRISQLLPPGSVLPEAYLDGVEVVRYKEDLTTEVVNVDLRKAWGGENTQDLVLRPRDLITVRSEYQGYKTVAIVGEVKLQGNYTVGRGERLSSVLKRAGGFTDKAFLKGAVFTRRSVQEIEKKSLNEFLRQQEESFLSEGQSGLLPVSLEGTQARQASQAQRREQLKVIASKATLGRIVIHFDDVEKLTGSANDLILEDGDVLRVPEKPAAVLVMGSVRNPTAIIHHEGEDIQYYLNRAGGLSDTAEQKGIYLLKADGSALTGFLRLRDVEVGDTIIVPPKNPDKSDWVWVRDVATAAGQAVLGLAAIKSIFF